MLLQTYNTVRVDVNNILKTSIFFNFFRFQLIFWNLNDSSSLNEFFEIFKFRTEVGELNVKNYFKKDKKHLHYFYATEENH